MVARHRFLDDALAHALADVDRATGAAAIEQVVILGAGLDSRALRFATALAGRPVFEVDFAATQARKLRALADASLDVDAAHFVACDFARERSVDALVRAPRFVPGRRTFVIWEGVSMYLPREAVRRTLNDVASICGPGSLLGMDFWFTVDDRDQQGLVRRALAHALPPVVGAIGEPFLFALGPEDAPAFLQASGLTVVDAAGARALSTRYVRDGRVLATSFHVVLARVDDAAGAPAGPAKRP
jgi:methyltransferase (TIGR00027 family)